MTTFLLTFDTSLGDKSLRAQLASNTCNKPSLLITRHRQPNQWQVWKGILSGVHTCSTGILYATSCAHTYRYLQSTAPRRLRNQEPWRHHAWAENYAQWRHHHPTSRLRASGTMVIPKYEIKKFYCESGWDGMSATTIFIDSIKPVSSYNMPADSHHQ